jgi:hypothetical protein
MEWLHFHPYKIQIIQQLTGHEKVAHVNFCRQFLEIMENDASVLDHLITSDEAHFHLSGHVNKQLTDMT